MLFTNLSSCCLRPCLNRLIKQNTKKHKKHNLQIFKSPSPERGFKIGFVWCKCKRQRTEITQWDILNVPLLWNLSTVGAFVCVCVCVRRWWSLRQLLGQTRQDGSLRTQQKLLLREDNFLHIAARFPGTRSALKGKRPLLTFSVTYRSSQKTKTRKCKQYEAEATPNWLWAMTLLKSTFFVWGFLPT